MSITKEKRTKEQMMRLLDRAIEQEEILLDQVKLLQSALTECRKTAENPRHELEERALPGSKVSFRLDFYQLERKGPFKGIVEHLPTRETQRFEGVRMKEVLDFIKKFVGSTARPAKEIPAEPLIIPEPEPVESEQKEHSPLLSKEIPDFIADPYPTQPDTDHVAPDLPESTSQHEPFIILTENKASHQRVVRKGEDFQIELRMQGLDAFQDKACNWKLSAKSMEKRAKPAFTLQEACIPNQDLLRIPIRAGSLDKGIYQLDLSLSVCDAPQIPGYADKRLLIVQ